MCCFLVRCQLRQECEYTCSVSATVLCLHPSHQVSQFLALLGVVYSIGGALLYHLTLSYLPAWFLTRRGLANGVVFAGTAVGGVFLPLILPPLLQRYSRVTSRYIGVAVGIGLIPGMIWIKPRVPERARARPRAGPERWHSSSRQPLMNRVKENIKGRLSWWFSHRAFAILLLANTAQGFGYFMPLIWLPSKP
jgi:MFS transporter, MCT family, solute carrier family 16 (monocarboxylic acid transporters), member 10